MKSITRAILALVVAATFAGCTVAPYVHERNPSFTADAACFTGEVCSIWALQALHSVR
jgi:hypothetical protein